MFDWDKVKKALTIAKHGIGSATAVCIFFGPVFTSMHTRFDCLSRKTSSQE